MDEFEFSDIVQEEDPPKRGIKSYLNPKNWGVDDYSSEKDFNSAFKKAKKEGKKDFLFGDNRYTTDVHQRMDASKEKNFNTAFRKARNAEEKEFLYNGKVFTTDLVSKWVSDNYKESKNFIRDYLNKNSLSLSKIDSLQRDPFETKFPYLFKQKQENDKTEAISQLNKPAYTSITEQKGKLKSDGFVSPYENKVFIYSKENDPELFTGAVHELTHKAGLIANEPVKKNANNKRFFVDDGYLIDSGERGARHMATIFYLNSKGHAFDKFTDKEYKVLKDAEEDLPYDIYQLMELYADKKEFIRQMNIPLGYKNDVGGNKKNEEEFNFDDILDK